MSSAEAKAGPRPSGNLGGCINRPTILGLGLGGCVLIGMLLMVQWVDLMAAERRAARLVKLQSTGRGEGSSVHTLPLKKPSQRPKGQGPVGVVMQRTVALIPFGDTDLGETRGILVRDLGLGVQFDLSPELGVVVSAVDTGITADSGLAVGDRVISLAGVAVAADHDPLAALDEAEDAIRGELHHQRAFAALWRIPIAPP